MDRTLDSLTPADHQKALALIDDYTFYSDMDKEATQGKRAAARGIVELFQSLDMQSLDVGSMRFYLSSTTTRRIVREKLLERGVPLEVILYATEETVSEPHIRSVKLGERTE